MFENIIEQGAVVQLKNDLLRKKTAPSMLFFGPAGSGKGSSVLELARVLSCEDSALWKCTCAACERHRYLQHTDLLALGFRPFSAEIAACANAFVRTPFVLSTKLLFIRSIRKLQMRFSPVLVEDDPKLSKYSSVLQSLEENLSEFLSLPLEAEKTLLEKITASLLKNANTLADEGFGTTIPIAHIRKASSWCRLAPNGKRKTLVIENADNMRDEARNSLLKLLEEPPSTVSIILTSGRRETIMPTILSRLRPYRFLKRSSEGEKEIIRRVFQDSLAARKIDENSIPAGTSLVSLYLDSFVQNSGEKMYPLAAFFLSSLARLCAAVIKNRGGEIPVFFSKMGERYTLAASDAGFARTVKISVIVKTLLDESKNFEEDSFSRFLKICLDMTADITREIRDPHNINFMDLVKKYINEADTAVNILNISTSLALESLLYNLKKSIIQKGTVYA